MGMELEVQRPPPPVDIEETPPPPSRPQPIVKLLECKPLQELPPPNNLMLWVDGALAPALQQPLFIDVTAARALSRTGPDSTASGMKDGRAKDEPFEETCEGFSSDSAGGEGANPSRSSSAAVTAAAAAAVRGAVQGILTGSTQHDAQMNEQITRDGLKPEEGLLRVNTGVEPGGTPKRDTQSARPSSAELSPPVIAGRPVSSAKRTRPASACACFTTDSGYGSAGASSHTLSRVGSDVIGLSDVIEEWQLESPSKRPSISDSRSPPALAGLAIHTAAAPPAALPAVIESPLRPTHGALRPAPTRPPTRAAPTRPPTRAHHRPPTACSLGSTASDTPYCTPEPSLATPSSAARAAADVAAAAAAAASCASASAASAAAAASASAAVAAATAQPTAPPPSPVIGPRPTSREVPWGAKRKERSAEMELPSSLMRVESGLDALCLEPRPAKLLRLGGVAVSSGSDADGDRS